MRDGKRRRRAARRKGKPAKAIAVSGNGASPPLSPARRQRLVVRRVDIRSVFKLSVIFYLSLSCVVLVAAMILWLVATASGVRGNVEKFIGDLVVAEDFELVGSRMLQLGAIMSVVLVVLGTAANLVMATLYNLISDMVGGVSLVVEGSRVSTDGGEPVEVADGDRVSSRRAAPPPSPRPSPQ